MFRPKKPLDVVNLGGVPRAPGVYIVYRKNGPPFYVGRSTTSIYDRLYAHASTRGSRKIREAILRSEELEFEWEELWSPHQAEAILISRLGTIASGNLRARDRSG